MDQFANLKAILNKTPVKVLTRVLISGAFVYAGGNFTWETASQVDISALGAISPVYLLNQLYKLVYKVAHWLEDSVHAIHNWKRTLRLARVTCYRLKAHTQLEIF